MKPLNFVLFFSIIYAIVVWANLYSDNMESVDKRNKRHFEEAFSGATKDVGTYLVLLESQQESNGVRYSKEKQLSVNKDVVSVFYSNLAMRLGISGDTVAIQNLMMHIPAMAIVRHDGFNLITITDAESDTSLFEPIIHPLRPYAYTLPSGASVFFTLDNNLTYYDPNTNQFISGTYDEVSAARDLSPMTSVSKFESLRDKTIRDNITQDLSAAINKHMELITQMGMTIEFSVPESHNEEINRLGFLAFIQGYPLPGGIKANSFSFGAGTITLRSEYIGVIRGDGRHVAYEAACGIPEGSYPIERLRNAKEAARKGYFTSDCPVE